MRNEEIVPDASRRRSTDRPYAAGNAPDARSPGNAWAAEPAGAPGANRDVFVGREAELTQLRALAADARAGTPRVTLVLGAAGAGKTSLIQALLSELDGFRILRGHADEAESRLAFGLLDQLMERLPVSRPAQDSVLDLTLWEDPLAAGGALLESLAAAQRERPLALVVDDVHWSDPPSLHALVFALRRLRNERLLVLLACRGTDRVQPPAPLHRLSATGVASTVAVAGLSHAELRQLLSSTGANLSHRTAKRLWDHTGGNPSHALEIVQAVPAESLHAFGVLLPAPRSVASDVLARSSRCSPPTERMVAAAAVLGDPSQLATIAELADIEEPFAALEEASAAGLLDSPPMDASPRVAFPDRLTQAAVYYALGPGRRAALHAAAASLVEDAGARLRHRVLASAGPSESLAEELARYGHGEGRAGRWAVSTRYLIWASHLSPDPADRGRLLLEAAESLVLSGDIAEAEMVAEAVPGLDPHRHYVLGFIAFMKGRLSAARQHLLAAASSELLPDPALAARAAHQLCVLALQRGVEVGVEVAPPAHAAGDPDVVRPPWWPHVDKSGTMIIGVGLPRPLSDLAGATGWYDAESEAGIPGREEAGRHGPTSATLERALAQGFAAFWTDDLARARNAFTRLTAARDAAPFQLRLLGLLALAKVEVEQGDWDLAESHADMGLFLANEAGQVWLQCQLHAVAALPLAHRGSWERAAEHARAAGALAHRQGDRASASSALGAETSLALARGDHDLVVQLVDNATGLSARRSPDELWTERWRDQYAESLVHLGRLDEAEIELAAFEAAAATGMSSAPNAMGARVRGRLEAARGNSVRADGAFRAALAHLEDRPFDQGLAALAYGQFLRRAGRRQEAAERLAEAAQRFAYLGAEPWLARCEAEVAACGLLPEKRRSRDRTRLTAREIEVASLATSGLTNREIASELIVTVKTVEFHLGRVFTKLGVTSRGQLAAALAKSLGRPEDPGVLGGRKA